MFAAALEQAIQLNLTMEIQNEAVAAAPAANEGTERLFLPLTVKIDLCMKAERLVRAEKSMSLKAFCREHEIQPSQLRRWEKKLVFMKQALDITKKKASKKSCQPGRPSRLEKYRNDILPWVLALRKQGKSVSTRMVSLRASKVDRSLRRMKRYTVFQMVRRFLNANGIVMRATTHTSQEDGA